ncbi:MAG: urate hydroxylase PuuD [Gammaproteobacteria bacterium]|nr:urate hydroxylase PuuD [Gammaproteobacteria bacterium]
MEAHAHEWLNLLLRWIHFIVGIAWIGASFYFNWLENNLDREPPQDEGIDGNLWAVHGGGFYYLKKFTTGPERLPSSLHWFKWEAYTTWLSGVALLVLIYYFNARAWLIDPSVRDLEPWQGIATGIASLVVSWFVYDGLCRVSRERPGLMTAMVFGWFALLAFILTQLLSGRAAYIHVGAAIGTVMVANVFFVIIPAQRELVSALKERRPTDPGHGRNGLLRSRHNNYFTLPVLFTMISSHFPSTYGNSLNWLVLVLLALVSIAVRHYFNVRHLGNRLAWILPAAFLAMVGLMWLTAPRPAGQGGILVSDAEASAIVTTHCAGCHAAKPTFPGFITAPKGIELDTMDKIRIHRVAINQVTVLTKTMPLGNLTGMLDEERTTLGHWVQTQENAQ